MSKVSTFDANSVKLSCDEPSIRNTSERWVVQFVGAPGFSFNGVEHQNVHFVCPYRKFDWGWGIDPWRQRLLVKSFDFERGVVIVDGIIKELEFYVDNKEYN